MSQPFRTKKITAKKIASSEITSEADYRARRRFMQQAMLLGMGTIAAPMIQTSHAQASKPDAIADLKKSLTSYEHITNYNNFYEFSTGKEAVAELAKDFSTANWTLRVDGECDAPKTWTLEALAQMFASEERIYRFRCVEGWSMVIPWQGFELNKLLKLAKPNSRAKYVAFETLVDPEQFPNQRKGLFNRTGIDWPYREGLRIDEAMHPLTLIADGLYGKPMPNQNGAPLRLVVPWKYGFKSIKSIVGIRFVEKEPHATWNQINAREYGFYSNVNPNVDHPRWSQKKERVIGGGLFKIPTQLFNGYADEVADLYRGMDLTKYY
ncbi:protein-methionine-sulfoxide reductase catalytic subunit MsrP [Ostreibacterium oceani]|uniref:Protein-methionine-sulfoxide reductase catalytic subunit MsrP n=1 Tax=Ostreibacterium oceani TaxID=2654998 RepID=A0A6N7EY36_9GAMM|nr:protein-methionine-sulfoxide reductase catalytic subunit MsrP [Ostreibacterium oceani]MPV86299.1 protein-methionine-sulfoxide reductase catalytic subunit MsrP [Ostreibacterium oceani]